MSKSDPHHSPYEWGRRKRSSSIRLKLAGRFRTHTHSHSPKSSLSQPLTCLKATFPPSPHDFYGSILLTNRYQQLTLWPLPTVLVGLPCLPPLLLIALFIVFFLFTFYFLLGNIISSSPYATTSFNFFFNWKWDIYTSLYQSKFQIQKFVYKKN